MLADLPVFSVGSTLKVKLEAPGRCVLQNRASLFKRNPWSVKDCVSLAVG